MSYYTKQIETFSDLFRMGFVDGSVCNTGNTVWKYYLSLEIISSLFLSIHKGKAVFFNTNKM